MPETDKHLNSIAKAPDKAADSSALSDTEQQFAQGYKAILGSEAGDNLTFGEKLHHTTFDIGLNFAANLAVSAAFTHWVKHSHKPVWENAPFAKNFFKHAPEDAHGYVKNIIRDKLKISNGVAERMADALTLTTGGHFVMIPSVWLGEKIKTSFVQAADNWKYGKDVAENDPWIVRRHQYVNQEDKPTLLGAVVGRTGTVLAVQTAAMTLGDEKNVLNWAGKKFDVKALRNFNGLDAIAGKVGVATGTVLSDLAPKASKNINSWAHRMNLSVAKEPIEKQLKSQGLKKGTPAYNTEFKTVHKEAIKNKSYDTTVQDYSKYVALDTMYTWVTMATVRPIINYAKGLVPGITSNEKPIDARPGVLISQAENHEKMLDNQSQQRA